MRINRTELGSGLSGVDFVPEPLASELERQYQRLDQELRMMGLDEDDRGQYLRDARAALSSIYHSTMIETNADPVASAQAVRDKLRDVMQLAELVPIIKGETGAGVEERGDALRQALEIIRERNIAKVKDLYPWLNEHVKNDDVLRAAGLNVGKIRDSAGDRDFRALLSMLRTALDLYIRTGPDVGTTSSAMTAADVTAQVDFRRAAVTARVVNGRPRPDPTSPFAMMPVRRI